MTHWLKRRNSLSLFAFILFSCLAIAPRANAQNTAITLSASRLRAQVSGPHSVALSWTLSTDDTSANCTASAGCIQTLYRANGACSVSSVFAIVNASVASSVIAFTDTTPTPGNICYGLTFTINGAESVKDTVSVTLPPSPPTGLAGTGH